MRLRREVRKKRKVSLVSNTTRKITEKPSGEVTMKSDGMKLSNWFVRFLRGSGSTQTNCINKKQNQR